MARALLHEIRRDVRNYYYDTACSFRSDQSIRDFFASYSFGSCTFTSWIANELLQRLGFDVHIVSIGHVTLFFRLGSGYVNLDTSYNIVAYFADRADILRRRDWLLQQYKLSDGSPLDVLSVESYVGVMASLDVPQGAATPMVRYSMPGLPLSLGDEESVWLDYSGERDGAVVATFLARDKADGWMRRVFPGRLEEVRLTFVSKPSKTRESQPRQIEYSILPAFTEQLYGISQSLELKVAGKWTLQLKSLSRSSYCAGRCSYTVFLRNDGMLDNLLTGSWEKYYLQNKDIVIKATLRDGAGKVMSLREVDASTDLIFIEGVASADRTPATLELELSKNLPLPTSFSSRLIEGKLALEPATESTSFGGFNEIFLENGSLASIISGQLEIAKSLPYTPHGVAFKNIPAFEDVEVRHRFHTSGLAFPFIDAINSDRAGLAFVGTGGPLVAMQKEDHPQPLSVTLNASASGNGRHPAPITFNLHFRDHLGRPVDDICVDFDGLMSQVFPSVPLYSKDKARRDLACQAYTNRRGVASFIVDSGDRLPKKITAWRPLAIGQNAPKTYSLDR